MAAWYRPFCFHCCVPLPLPLPHPLPEEVPANASQRAAVESLRGGLSIIHGPPGTGKSTTIFHLIDARVQPDAQVGGPTPVDVGGRGARVRLHLALRHRSSGSWTTSSSQRCLPATATTARPWQVLVTCTRNQAVDSVVGKVARLEGGILVFGNAKRLGERAALYTLEARVEAHPAVVRSRCRLPDAGQRPDLGCGS